MVDDGFRSEQADETTKRVREGADPNFLFEVKTPWNDLAPMWVTPLYLAAMYGRNDDVQYLLQKGANPDGVPGQSDIPLSGAFARVDDTLAVLLLERGARPIGLCRRCQWRDEPAARTVLLLRYGADPNTPCCANVGDTIWADYNKTPLLNAVYLGNVAISRALLEHGANPELHEAHSFSPLATTAYAPHTDARMLQLARLLLEHGADVNCRTGRNQLTPLMLSCLNPGAGPFLFSFVELLLEYGADVNARGTQGQTPLLVACRSGYADVVRLLLKHGADPNARDNEGNDPARFAEKHPAVRTALLRTRGG